MECGYLKAYSCSRCGKAFAFKHHVNKHLNSKGGTGWFLRIIQRFICRNCGKKYKFKTSLNKHLKDECGVLPKYNCCLCPYAGKQKVHLKTHMPAQMPQVRPQLQTPRISEEPSTKRMWRGTKVPMLHLQSAVCAEKIPDCSSEQQQGTFVIYLD
ncbi:hypothetical protein HUJ05_009011 [Dendroctonus ponderosae]|nr:hypothetical protein HUJ05_009011 [Dendroctonus ponderosae]